jgi:hypothetical protein
MGQLVDLITAPEDRVDLSKLISQVMLFSDILPPSVPILTIHRHRTIDLYKTTIYSFYLPSRSHYSSDLCGFPVEKKHEYDPDHYCISLHSTSASTSRSRTTT